MSIYIIMIIGISFVFVPILAKLTLLLPKGPAVTFSEAVTLQNPKGPRTDHTHLKP